MDAKWEKSPAESAKSIREAIPRGRSVHTQDSEDVQHGDGSGGPEPESKKSNCCTRSSTDGILSKSTGAIGFVLAARCCKDFGI